jgi:alanyl aminopeptidase
MRLSNDVVPVNYNLALWLDPQKKSFTGSVTISLNIKKLQQELVLNCKDLRINLVELYATHKTLTASPKTRPQDLVLFNFGEALQPGSYKLVINYEADYQCDLTGLYKITENNTNYLFSQFEPIYARSMMPSFDEPSFKTSFEITVISPKDLRVVSNTPEANTRYVGNDAIHRFAKTPPMPTYLLALAVGNLDIIEGPNLGAQQNIIFRGIATKGKGKKLSFAMKETPKILAELENYFGMPYPYEKLDIIAVPDFKAGAMENIGAITFREYYLLLNKNASRDQEQKFFDVMAHELAHQWFGNSVTMPWWDDLWLNEAFATWLSHKIIASLRPDFKMPQKLLTRSHNVMNEDSLVAARIIREPITSNHDIHNAFDGITYSKGAAMLGMLENFLGSKNFRLAVADHLRRFKNAHANYADFMNSLAKYSDNKLTQSAATFLNQSGVPVINFAYSCTNNKVTLNLAQQRFTPVGSKASKEYSWHIPVCIGLDTNAKLEKHCFWLNKPEEQIVIASSTCPTLLMPNFNGQGYYRFSLAPQQWEKLLQAPTILLSDNDRLSVADSLLAELESGRLNFDFVAENLSKLVSSDSPHITNYFINFLSDAQNYWVDTKNHGNLLRYAHDILKPIYNQLRVLEKPNAEQQELKGEIARFLADNLHDQKTRQTLKHMGANYLKNIKNPHLKTLDYDENIIGNALSITLQEQDDKKLETTINLFKNHNDIVIRTNLLNALARARKKDQSGAERIRKLVFDKSLRKNEHLALLFRHVADGQNQPSTWNFLVTNLNEFKNTLPKTQLGRLPELAVGLCSDKSAQDVRNLLEPIMNEYEGGPRNLAENIELIEICAAKKQRTATLANSYFEHQQEKLKIKQTAN